MNSLGRSREAKFDMLCEMREKFLLTLLALSVGVICYDHLFANRAAVKAQSLRVWVQQVDESVGGTTGVKGSPVLGFSCTTQNSRPICFVLSQQ